MDRLSIVSASSTCSLQHPGDAGRKEIQEKKKWCKVSHSQKPTDLLDDFTNSAESCLFIEGAAL